MLEAAGPAATVLGIEREAAQRKKAEELRARSALRERLEFRPGDAMALPLREAEWRTFDVVHTRFLLEHVPQPLAVVEQMVRAARPGGRVILEDDDHDLLRLWPVCPEIDALWKIYESTYVAVGNDPIVGRRLVELLQRAGASPTRNDWLFFGACTGHPEFGDYVTNLRGVLVGAREAMLRTQQTTAEEIDDALQALERWAQRPDAALWYCSAWAEGVVR